MIHKVFKATCEHPLKNDFVQTCNKYLETLEIKLTYEKIEEMSEFSFKKIVKQKTIEAAFKYLMEQKNKPGKHTKIQNIEYKELCIQEYLLEGNMNTEISKLIYKMRGKTLDIKEHKKWKNDDNLCVGCDKNVETENELLSCPGFCEENETKRDKISYSVVFGDSVGDMVRVAKEIRKRLKVREKILDAG